MDEAFASTLFAASAPPAEAKANAAASATAAARPFRNLLIM
jgi:hypothetical protein